MFIDLFKSFMVDLKDFLGVHMNITELLARARQHIEAAAFLVSKEGAARQAHAELISALVSLAEVERLWTDESLASGVSEVGVPAREVFPTGRTQRDANEPDTSEEVDKVRNRLDKFWAKRQHQVNARILNAFLRLTAGKEPRTISEHLLRTELKDIENFDSNFIQMKTIAPKNHGKVFQQHGSTVSIWDPVLPFVLDYEKAVFQRAGNVGDVS